MVSSRNIFQNLLNSPPGDEISIKRTKYNIIRYSILLTICIFIFTIVFQYNSDLNYNSKQSYLSNEIHDTLETPGFSIYTTYTNISRFSINYMNFTEDPYLIDYQNYFYCIVNSSIVSSNCYNFQKNDVEIYGKNSNHFFLDSFNLTNEENYMNINFQMNTPKTDQIYNLSWSLYFDGIYYFFTGSENIQILLKKEIYIDSKGNKRTKILPDVISSIDNNDYCTPYEDNDIHIENCSHVTISIYYKDKVVNIYSEETNAYFALRVLKNSFSIGNIVLVILSLLLSSIFRKLFYKDSKYDNSIRDAVLFHLKEYMVERVYKERKNKLTQLNVMNSIKENQSRIKNCLENLVFNIKYYFSNEYIDEDPTLGSDKKFKRLFEGFELQDKFSRRLSFISKIQLLVLVLLIVGVSITVIVYNLETNTIITQYNDYEILELPNFKLTYKREFSSSAYWWPDYLEMLPNKDGRVCDYDYGNRTFICQQFDLNGLVPNPITEYPNDTAIFDFPKVIYNSSTISLKRGEFYYFLINLFEEFSYYGNNSIYVELEFNNSTYYLNPYGENRIQLTKTILIEKNGNTKTIYDPAFISEPFKPINYGSYGDIDWSLGYVNFNFSYSSYVVKEIYQKSDFHILIKLITDISSFISPIKILVTFLFTKIIIKVIYDFPSAHVEFETREYILFYLNNYKKYKPIFKKSINTDNNLNINETLD